MNIQNKNIAVILAGGRSTRFGSNKLKSKIGNKTVLEHTVEVFKNAKFIDEVLIIQKGEKTRQNSSFKAIEKISKNNPHNEDVIIFHNGANPLVTKKEIKDVINAAKKYGAAIVAHEIVDTIKEVKSSEIIKTISRENLWAAQTPQAFKWEIIEKAYENAKAKKLTFTDESSMVEAIGHKVHIIKASEFNKKITFKNDLEYTKAVLGIRPKNFKVGIGQDSHEFHSTKKGLALGGVTFKKHKAFQANSDGDVILHALSNAVSSAMGGRSFSFVADPFCKKGEKRSTIYLKEILKSLKDKKLKPHNLSITLQGSKPKLESLIPKIKKSLSKILALNGQAIGITAHSGEKLTPFGEGKGLQCIVAITLINES